MIDHIEIRTQKMRETTDFYTLLLGVLGYERKRDDAVKGFGDGQGLDFFIVEGSPSVDVHYAFHAPTRALVNAVYEAGRNAGLTLDRAPALAPNVHEHYYAGYLRDPDDRLIEFVCQKPE